YAQPRGVHDPSPNGIRGGHVRPSAGATDRKRSVRRKIRDLDLVKAGRARPTRGLPAPSTRRSLVGGCRSSPLVGREATEPRPERISGPLSRAASCLVRLLRPAPSAST